jgi:hypothetical protein
LKKDGKTILKSVPTGYAFLGPIVDLDHHKTICGVNPTQLNLKELLKELLFRGIRLPETRINIRQSLRVTSHYPVRGESATPGVSTTGRMDDASKSLDRRI